MTRLSRTIMSYAELSRLSNLPTCLSNTLVGGAIAVAAGVMPVATLALVAAGVASLYIAGMAMNDAMDVRIDRIERPSRPIPSGRITPAQAWTFVIIFIVLGLALLAWTTLHALIAGAVLVVMISLYNALHKRTPAAVVLMGLCRALVYVVAASAVVWPLPARLYPFAAALMLYTIGITVIARMENESFLGVRRWLALAMPVVPVLLALFVMPVERTWWLMALPAMVGWLGIAATNILRPQPRTKNAVMMWLSGMCLVDAYFLTLLDQPIAAGVAGVCFVATTLAHRRIMGT